MTTVNLHKQFNSVSVATSSTPVLGAELAKEYCLLENDSDTAIYVMWGGPAVVNQGVLLNADGGSYEMSRRNGNMDARAVTAIHGGTGTKNLLVVYA